MNPHTPAGFSMPSPEQRIAARTRAAKASAATHERLVRGYANSRPRDFSRPVNATPRPASMPDRVPQKEFDALVAAVAKTELEIKIMREQLKED